MFIKSCVIDIVLVYLLDLATVPTVSELLHALEEYLPILLGLAKKGLIFFSRAFYVLIPNEYLVIRCIVFIDNRLEALVEFKWKNLGDDQVRI